MPPTIVGIVNVTPDSFSDGGRFVSADSAVAHAETLLDEGADVVEIGGESTRPGAQPVASDQERRRVIPVIEALRLRRPSAHIAIDTIKPEIAAAALDAGANIVNDVSALRLDPKLAEVCAQQKATLILMHSRGTVADMARYDHAQYEGPVMNTICAELMVAVGVALGAGLGREQIVLDPGLGFSKTSAQSLEALANLSRLADLGFAVMIGASRKRFLGELTGVQTPADRDAATVGANVAALARGATWFRVHAVRANRHALDVAYATLFGAGEGRA